MEMKQQAAMVVQRIRIPSHWRISRSPQLTASGVADFCLGIGPCGKNVVHLDCKLSPDYVMVIQVTDDGESKDFYYPIATITGRVEITKK